MKLPIFQASQTIFEQLNKVKEECNEVLDAYGFEESKERIASEIFDLLQATINLLHQDYSELEIEQAAKEHNLKMLERVKSRGYNIKSFVKIIKF